MLLPTPNTPDGSLDATALIALNNFLTVKISFANFLSQVCASTPGADIDTITDAYKAFTPHVIDSSSIALIKTLHADGNSNHRV